MTTNKKILLAAGAVVAVIAVGLWLFLGSQIAQQYADAAADCENGLGAGRLLALDRLHGEDARPRQLAFTLSLCAADAAVDKYKKAAAAAAALSP